MGSTSTLRVRNSTQPHLPSTGQKPLPYREHKATITMLNDRLTRSEIQSDDVSRRSLLQSAFLAAAGAAVPLYLPEGSFAAEARQVFDPIPGERFTPLTAVFTLPEGWTTRPGQKPKPGKFLLYTDTYGPNYRYFSNWPKLKDAEGQCVDSIQVLVQGLSGLESIADLGPIQNLDPQRAFGIEREDILQADVSSAVSRKDANGQVYYEWEINTTEGTTVLVSAAASGGALYTLAVGATGEQWSRGGEAMKGMLQSFSVAPAEESSVDLSERIYGTRKEGGFS